MCFSCVKLSGIYVSITSTWELLNCRFLSLLISTFFWPSECVNSWDPPFTWNWLPGILHWSHTSLIMSFLSILSSNNAKNVVIVFTTKSTSSGTEMLRITRNQTLYWCPFSSDLKDISLGWIFSVIQMLWKVKFFTSGIIWIIIWLFGVQVKLEEFDNQRIECLFLLTWRMVIIIVEIEVTLDLCLAFQWSHCNRGRYENSQTLILDIDTVDLSYSIRIPQNLWRKNQIILKSMNNGFSFWNVNFLLAINPEVSVCHNFVLKIYNPGSLLNISTQWVYSWSLPQPHP